MAEVHVFETLLDVLVCALQEAVELVDMLQENVGDIGGRLLEALVQQNAILVTDPATKAAA